MERCQGVVATSTEKAVSSRIGRPARGLKAVIQSPDTLGQVYQLPPSGDGPPRVVRAPLSWHLYRCHWDERSERLAELEEFGATVYDDILVSCRIDPELWRRFKGT